MCPYSEITCKSCMVFMARFDGVHAFGYNSAGSEAIWMKIGHSEYIVNCRWPWQGTHCCQLSNYIEPSVYSGDAPNVKLLSPVVIFGRPHIQSHR